MTAIVFVFTLILADFFDAMGTIIGISGEAGLLDEEGRLPGIGRVLFIDGLAAVGGRRGLGVRPTRASWSRRPASARARAPGLANIVTGALLFLAAFLTPMLTIVPSQAAAPGAGRGRLPDDDAGRRTSTGTTGRSRSRRS